MNATAETNPKSTAAAQNACNEGLLQQATSPATLYVRSEDSVELSAAIKLYRDSLPTSEGYALLYAPERCYLARLNAAGELVVLKEDDVNPPDMEETVLDCETVFEARVFNDQAELRWLKTGENTGQAVVLSEQPIAGHEDKLRLDACGTLPQRYLLWGKGVTAQLPAQWSRLTTARIGRLDVPLDGVQPNERVQLCALEYLKEDAHGNVAVVDERLLGLERVPPPVKPQAKATEEANNG